MLALPLYYCQEIQHYRKVQLEKRLTVPDWQDTNFVFTTKKGAPIRPNRLSNYFGSLRRKLGIKSTFHMLRHDMASRMKNSSQFDLKDIQTQLGHSSINITMDIYTHIDNEAQQTKVSTWLEEDLTELMEDTSKNNASQKSS
ncbi:tyrosine-type recombinase/integrase [Selenomonas sp. AB3002]|uniref:site-specific integrase n=1 Tax=Selenomonas sp. AB3002 TaxID=1392502 RepID=UPI000496BEFE